MGLLKEIYESDINTTDGDTRQAAFYKIRKAARAVIFNNNDEIALLFVSKDDYHKLPAGGIESGESIAEALNREILEETGCARQQSRGDIGVILEFRNKFEQLQISYCYSAKLIEIYNKPNFTEKELSQGFELKWIKINDAIDI